MGGLYTKPGRSSRRRGAGPVVFPSTLPARWSTPRPAVFSPWPSTTSTTTTAATTVSPRSTPFGSSFYFRLFSSSPARLVTYPNRTFPPCRCRSLSRRVSRRLVLLLHKKKNRPPGLTSRAALQKTRSSARMGINRWKMRRIKETQPKTQELK